MYDSKLINFNMNLARMKVFIVALSLGFFSFTGIAIAAGAAVMGTCTLPTSGSGTNSTGSLDGSSCGSGLVCDSSILVCTNPTETACMAGANGAGCTIGQKCMTTTGSTTFQTVGQAGICATSSGGSSENNALGDVICNVYKLVTGKVGRGIIVIVLFVTGITFYLGKVNWGTIVAIVMGAGLCFGGPAVVSVLVGKSFLC